QKGPQSAAPFSDFLMVVFRCLATVPHLPKNRATRVAATPHCAAVEISRKRDSAPRSAFHCHDLAALTCDDRRKMLGPTCECDGFLPGISGAVICSGDASLVAADVIQNGLDDMGRNP